MTNLSKVSSFDLIKELEMRDEWIETYIISKKEYFNDCSFIIHVAKHDIPAKVIVVKYE